VFFSCVLLLVTFPNGDTALYSWFYLVFVIAVSALATVSLTRVDPLDLRLRPAPTPTSAAGG
jgi:alpha-1,6-mannosyltransferase